MPSCLGVYIENNIIKYAKLTKERENIKIDSFGVKFFEKEDDAIKQIISETFSFKTPISTNLSEEQYTYESIFSLLNKKDLEKAISTQFDFFCNETKKHRNAMEFRRLLIKDNEDRDKLKVLYVYADKSEIVGKTQLLNGSRVSNIVPLPISIKNLGKFVNDKNSIIINIEDKTSVTTVVENEVFKVDTIDLGMKQILDEISSKENSYAKAYEICKNTTIYTQEGKNLQIEENDYLQDIMPVLYSIIEKVKTIIANNGIQIDDIYITGTATVINNLDLYFQENFLDKKCEILAPFFANKSNLKINIRDYIEVNSAIALALEGLGVGTKEINFKNNPNPAIAKLMNAEIGKSNPSDKNKKAKKTISMPNIKMDFRGSLDIIEKNLIRTAVFVLFLFIAYTAFEKIVLGQINKKDIEIQEYIVQTQGEIDKLAKKETLIIDRASDYEEVVNKINEQNNKITEDTLRENAIPNLMNKIMQSIPKEVQLLSIKNTTDKKIVIQAQSKKYEQLGYFVATLKNDGILTDVTSTLGEKPTSNSTISVTIEGNLP